MQDLNFLKNKFLKKWVLKGNENTSPFSKEAGQSAEWVKKAGQSARMGKGSWPISQSGIWWSDEFFVFVFHTCIEIPGLKF